MLNEHAGNEIFYAEFLARQSRAMIRIRSVSQEQHPEYRTNFFLVRLNIYPN